jgi:hypothetical protein
MMLDIAHSLMRRSAITDTCNLDDVHDKKDNAMTMLRISRPRQFLGSALGLLVGVPIMTWLLSPVGESARSHGPRMPGHETLECSQCHDRAPGTLRQQLQAKVRFALGQRREDATFGLLPVTNRVCSECHERSEDRHPAHRFLEPRFEAARRDLGAHRCISCHPEHEARRLSQPITFCQSCHGGLKDDLKPEHDAIAPSHAQLVEENKWESCLSCHDFHGNHEGEAPRLSDPNRNPVALEHYFVGVGADDPFGKKRNPSRSARRRGIERASGQLTKWGLDGEPENQ